MSVGSAARDKLLRRPPTPAAPAASGGGKTAGKYIKDCLKGVVIDSMVNAIVSGAKQNWIRFRENEGIYREVGEYWWDHFIMTTVSRTLPEETYRQFGNHVKRQLKDRVKDAVTDYRVQAHVREMAQNFISGLPDDLINHPEIQRAARERAQAELSGEKLKEFRKLARDLLGSIHSWKVNSELEFLLQEVDVIDFARKAIGEELSVYWANSSDWTRYGPEQIKRYHDIIDCLKKKEEKVGPVPVLVHLRLAEDSYRDFIRECRTTEDGKETAAEVRARELEEARKLLEEVDALQATLPSHLGIALTEFETDVAAVDRAVDQKEADLIPFLEDPAVRCDPPSEAGAAFRAKAEGAESEVQGLTALRDQAGGYRDQACESLERTVVEDAARLARHTAGQAGQTATTVSAAIAALIQEGEQADPGARLRAFSVDDVQQTFDRVTGKLKVRESDFEAVSTIEQEATTKIQRGQWLTGRWYDSESKSLQRTFNDRENVMIKYINTRDEYRALFETMDASARQIERIEADKEAALACVAGLYPLDNLRRRSASVPHLGRSGGRSSGRSGGLPRRFRQPQSHGAAAPMQAGRGRDGARRDGPEQPHLRPGLGPCRTRAVGPRTARRGPEALDGPGHRRRLSQVRRRLRHPQGRPGAAGPVSRYASGAGQRAQGNRAPVGRRRCVLRAGAGGEGPRPSGPVQDRRGPRNTRSGFPAQSSGVGGDQRPRAERGPGPGALRGRQGRPRWRRRPARPVGAGPGDPGDGERPRPLRQDPSGPHPRHRQA